MVFICKRSTLIKIIKYLRSSSGKEGKASQTSKAEKDVKNFVARNLLQLFIAANVPLSAGLSIDKDKKDGKLTAKRKIGVVTLRPDEANEKAFQASEI